MSKINDRYWIETDSFIHSALTIKSDTSYGIMGIPFRNFMHYIHKTTKTQVFHVLNSFHILKHSVWKPEPLYSIQYADLFVSIGFNMHTGQHNPHSLLKENISGKTVLDPSTKHVFPALNVSTNFTTLDYEAQINPEIDYTINHVFCSMTV